MNRQVFEQKVISLLRSALELKWRQQNKIAIQHYNHRIKKNGVFSDGLRRF
jgi:hypothetical protein